ncbi:hypothetical protein [Kitasatospora purpeofusca]|uniref:Uncharacterized protein n=1 Tax=Kitasatospora purpeofusca TaxID=67352 RepID=A0ABZ1UB88_9ACTN|nr:hypothetical protein [Kitasatospora purpeofusca]
MTDIRRPALRYTADITVEDIDGLAGFIERRVVLLREAAARPGGEEALIGEALTHTVTALTGSAREVLGTLAGHAAEAAGSASGPAGADATGGEDREDREVTAFDEEFEELMARLSRLWRYLLTAAEAWSHLPDYDVARWRLDGHLDAEHEARARWLEAGDAW